MGNRLIVLVKAIFLRITLGNQLPYIDLISSPLGHTSREGLFSFKNLMFDVYRSYLILLVLVYLIYLILIIELEKKKDE